MTLCPDCTAPLIEVGTAEVPWKHCNRCGWDERRELQEKIEQKNFIYGRRRK